MEDEILNYLYLIDGLQPKHWVNVSQNFDNYSFPQLRDACSDLRSHGYIEIQPQTPTVQFVKRKTKLPFNPYYIPPPKPAPPPPQVIARITWAGKKYWEAENKPIPAPGKVEPAEPFEVQPLILSVIEAMKKKDEDNSVNIYGNVGSFDNSKGKNVTKHKHAPAPEPKKSKTHWLQIVYWVVGIVGGSWAIYEVVKKLSQ